MATIKMTSTILFAVVLIGLGHFASSHPPSCSHRSGPICAFIHGLQEHLIRRPTALKFGLNAYVLHDLEGTTTEFLNLCVSNENKFGNPAVALDKAIYSLFGHYKENGDTAILDEIKEGDPIGFIAYLNEKNVDKNDSDFMRYANTFLSTMRSRIRLYKLNFELTNIPQEFRHQLATEYEALSNECINYFIKFAAKESKKKMYPVHCVVVDEIDTYTKTNVDDVQIILATHYAFNSVSPINLHATCINYKAATKMVHVYDSENREYLESRQKRIIEKLYPGGDIKYEKANALQSQRATCGVFAIAYAALLLNGKDPSTYPITYNNVYGDEAIYMRLYILDMLSQRKLFLPN